MIIVKIIFWYKNERLSSLDLDTLHWISNITSRFFSIKLGKTVLVFKNVEWDFAFTCNIPVQLVSLKTTPNWATPNLE